MSQYNWRDNLHKAIDDMSSMALDDDGDRQSVEIQMIFFINTLLGDIRRLIAPNPFCQQEFEKFLKGKE